MPEFTSLLTLTLTLLLHSNYSELFVYPARSLPFCPQPFYSNLRENHRQLQEPQKVMR